MKKITLLIVALVAVSFFVKAQDEAKEEKPTYQFEDIKRLPATPVKDQYRSGTCWSFSAISFLESELLRMGKGEFDLSEMFVVRNTYSEKAKLYVRMHGNLNFSAGGAFHDVPDMIKKFGIVPEEAYDGLEIGEKGHIHGEMDAVLNSYVDGVLKNKNRKLTPVWHKGFNGILDAYLGEYPEKFQYKGKEYTPQSFAEMLGLNMNDYLEFTSYTHHPFYDDFVLEVPDNWAWGETYNVPIDELIDIIDNAIEKGFTVAWAADVSETGFKWTKGVAVVPEIDKADLAGLERAKWSKMSKADQESKMFTPGKEKSITQEMRQEAFDNYKTTDDHGMHIVGTAKDQTGTKYYIVKNSWNISGNDYEGYFYASEAFVRYKTMDIMIHKDAVPKKLFKKIDDED